MLLSNYKFSTFGKRNKVRNKLAEEGIQTSVHYPAVHRFSIYKDFYANLPNTDYVSDNLITLPMFAALTDTDIDYIVSTLKVVINE